MPLLVLKSWHLYLTFFTELHTVFPEILPHLKIPPPLKCYHLFQPTHPNKHCLQNEAVSLLYPYIFHRDACCHEIPHLYLENKVSYGSNSVLKVFVAETTSFKSSGIICRLSLPFLLPDELPMDWRVSDSFFSIQIVYTVSDSIYNTTGSSTLADKLLNWLSSCRCWSGIISGGTAMDYIIMYNVHMCILVDMCCCIACTT